MDLGFKVASPVGSATLGDSIDSPSTNPGATESSLHPELPDAPAPVTPLYQAEADDIAIDFDQERSTL